MNQNRKIKILIALGALWAVACIVVAGAAEIRPAVAVGGGGWTAGATVSWTWGGAEAAHGKRNTEDGKTRYVEQAVALWRPAVGETVAAAGAGVADINAAVDARDEVIQLNWWGRRKSWVLENKKEIGVGSLVLTLAGLGIHAAEQQDWWGLFGRDTEDDAAARARIAAAEAAQDPRAAETAIRGDNNTVVNSWRMPPGADVPRSRTEIDGSGNTVRNEFIIEVEEE